MNLANRLVMPPMATAKAESDGKVSQALLDYYDDKSSGGHIALIIIEHSYITPDGKASNSQLSVCDDVASWAGLPDSDTVRRLGLYRRWNDN